MFPAVIQPAQQSVHSWKHDILLHMCRPSLDGGTSGAAASFLLLSHLLYLPLPPLQDLHPLGIVPFSLLSPELVHILEEPVPAPMCTFHNQKHHDVRMTLTFCSSFKS